MKKNPISYYKEFNTTNINLMNKLQKKSKNTSNSKKHNLNQLNKSDLNSNKNIFEINNKSKKYYFIISEFYEHRIKF